MYPLLLTNYLYFSAHLLTGFHAVLTTLPYTFNCIIVQLYTLHNDTKIALFIISNILKM